MFDHEKLDVYRCALELYATLAPAITAFPRGHGAIVDQLRRALLSIPLNIAEACGKTTVSDRQRFFAIARGSAMECAASWVCVSSSSSWSPKKSSARSSFYSESYRCSRGFVADGATERARARARARTAGLVWANILRRRSHTPGLGHPLDLAPAYRVESTAEAQAVCGSGIAETRGASGDVDGSTVSE